jgi:predicted RNA-binding Zn-ribbon protein involved in translation (DUF1610 family)
MCPRASAITCTAQTSDHECGQTWEPTDTDIPGPCPACGTESDYRRLRCESCPLTKLDESGAMPEGSLLRRVSQIDFALQSKFTLGLGDVTTEEFEALRILQQERDRYENEVKARNASSS